MNSDRETLEMPAPTFWPLVLAIGVTLMFAGLVTSFVLSGLGFLLFLAGLGNWIRLMVSPEGHMHEELVPISERARPIVPSRKPVQAMRPGMPGHRMRIPEKIHPYSAGLKGGIFGGIAMAVPALIWGILSKNGIFYPINLLAGMVLPSYNGKSVEVLQEFHLDGLIVGTLIHGATSIGVGLVYGVLLPMLPRMRFVCGAILAPLLWTGAIYSFMGALNPLLQTRVDWPWFVVSQFAYGIVVEFVVVRTEKIHASQEPPLKSLTKHDIKID